MWYHWTGPTLVQIMACKLILRYWLCDCYLFEDRVPIYISYTCTPSSNQISYLTRMRGCQDSSTSSDHQVTCLITGTSLRILWRNICGIYEFILSWVSKSISWSTSLTHYDPVMPYTYMASLMPYMYMASPSHNELMSRHRSWLSFCNVHKVLVCYLVGTKPIDNENFNRWVSKEHIDDIGMEFQFKFKWFHGLIQWWKSCLPYGDHLGPMRMEWGQMCVAYKYLSAKA